MTMEEDRRSPGQRVPFEALVVVASQKGGSGAYECEAVDVSERGMHLRTAYLPEIGQTLSFRFDGGSAEVVTEGVVQWRDEQAKGGEFGVKFTKLDPQAIAAIREICGVSEDGSPEETPKASKGSRVRLHIDGLGAPMRARVRDAQTGEVMVGSNLEFLRVGKPLELEDVERGKKRAAVVDKVEVEIDPASKVPQLVVTLRYDADAQNAGPPTLARELSPRSASSIATGGEKKAEGKSADSRKAEVKVVDEKTPLKPVSKEEISASEGEGHDGEAEGDDEKPGARLAARAKLIASEIGPKLGAASAAVKGKIADLVARVRERRAGGSSEGDGEGEGGDGAAKLRRVTSPPPEGGLHASGRHVVRGGREEPVEQEDVSGIEETDENAAKIRRKQRAIIGLAGGVLVLLIGIFAARSRTAPPGAEVAAASSAEALPALPAAALPPGSMPAAVPGAAGSGEAIAANVPLFGSVPLSTTEPAPMPAPSAQQGAAGAVAAMAGANPGGAGGDDDGPGGDDAEPGKGGSTQFGKGSVSKPRTVRLKMDAPIAELKGSTAPNAFSVMVPGRHNVESANTLAKRDKRLSSVKAVPKDGGTEVTFTFKDNVPPFLAKANGKMLEVDLGENPKPGDGDGEATAKKGHKKKHAVAKAEGGEKKKKTAQAGDKDKKKKGKKKKKAQD